MEAKNSLSMVYTPSKDVVAREVHGEFIIVPITSEAADFEDALFTLNKTGKAIWGKLDGKRSLKDIAGKLYLEFKGPKEEIERDILGLTGELLKRRMIVNVKKG